MLGPYLAAGWADIVKRALVLGGYGGFGARLSRRLAADGWQVIVAGRSEEKAASFAETLPLAESAQADREGDLSPVLTKFQPDLLIDAAGPFQGSGFHVAECCIAAGVHYLDLADSRGFVCGVGILDDSAQKAGVCVIAGASTLPAFSSAVLDELAGPMDRIESVEMALSAGSGTTASKSVVSAVLSYAGQLIPVWQGGRLGHAIGGQGRKRVRYHLPGKRALVRSVVFADVPDLSIVPEGRAGRSATAFHAGNEMGWQAVILGWLCWLVWWKLVNSLRSLVPLLAGIQRLLSPLGSDRSAMLIEVRGWRGEEGLMRRWTVMAEQGEGAEIPVLAAQLLARKLRAAELVEGARHAGGLLDLAAFRSLLSEIAAEDGISEKPVIPLYRRIIGSDYECLPDAVKRMHDLVGDGGAIGTAHVRRGTSLLSRFIGGVMRFPPAGEHDLHVHFRVENGVEHWTREFSGKRFHSVLSQSGNCIVERFGPMRFAMDLPVSEVGLEMKIRRWTLFGMPMSLVLAPRIYAQECAEGEDFLFEVSIALPLVGQVVEYRGRLRRL